MLAMKADQERELSQVKLEVAESTLTDVARDLHDDVGQLLSFSIIQMNNAKDKTDQQQKEIYAEARDSIHNALQSVRSISKILSSDYISSFGLYESLQRLFENASRQAGIEATLNYPHKILFQTAGNELLSFRILQECVNNTIKHSGATEITLSVREEKDYIYIQYDDNGKGLDENQVQEDMLKNSLGFTNIAKRTQMMNGTFAMVAKEERGIRFLLHFPNQ
jgi:signal transduction histidine kinase